MKRLLQAIHIFIIGLLIVGVTINAQPITNKAQLQKMYENEAERYRNERQAALKLAGEANIPLRIEKESQVAEFSRIHNGKPLFLGTNNSNSAITINADLLYNGGSAGLNLSGSGITLGIWDGGAVRNTHSEFVGRSAQIDNATSISNHATHVAGTMMASGVNPLARGMSWGARLRAFDWNDNDTELIMESMNGLKISNHSYGYITGWFFNYFGDGRWVWFSDESIDAKDAYEYGYYSDISSQVDQLTEFAPFHLLCIAAGNDRLNGPAVQPVAHWTIDPNTGGFVLSNEIRNRSGGPDGYDCISHMSVAKNALIVGAVNSIPGRYTQPADVVMSSFSSWGPVDDGRIKPDVVAKGVNMFSAMSGNDNAYGNMSGTSMATPSVSGAAGLLLQLYKDNFNTDEVLSSTMRALLIHTAEEAGPAVGPDYMNGWGLVNTEKAAMLISKDASYNNHFNIVETGLRNQEEIRFTYYANAGDEIKATVAWIDPAATPLAPQLNARNSMLVNDIDVRILTPNGDLVLPWKLDSTHPSMPATKDDNTVDNVEVVEFTATHTGLYTLIINHKGQLRDNQGMRINEQYISVITSGLENLIPPTLISPADLSFGTSVSPSFEWTEVERADSYVLEISNVSDFSFIVYGYYNISSTEFEMQSYLDSLDRYTDYFWRVKAVNQWGESDWSNVFEFKSAPQLPVITVQTESFVNCINNPVTISVTVDYQQGYVQYQWQKDGVNIIGENTETLELSGDNFLQSGLYRCIVTNVPGPDVVISNSIPVYITPNALDATRRSFTRVTPDQYVEPGGRLELYVETTLPSWMQQYENNVLWHKDGRMLVDDDRISGSRSTLLTINNVSAEDYTTQYECWIMNVCGNTAIISPRIAVRMKNVINITAEDNAMSACTGASVNLFVEAEISDNSNLSYQWYWGEVAITDEPGVFEGTQTKNLSVLNFSKDRETESVQCRVYSTQHNIEAWTSVGYAEYVQIAAIIDETEDEDIFVERDKELKLFVVAEGDKVEYQWFKGRDPILGANDSEYIVANVTTEDEGFYHCVVSNMCTTLETKKYFVTVTNAGFASVEEAANLDKNSIFIHPNPVESLATINFEVFERGYLELKLTDISGREILKIAEGNFDIGVHTLDLNCQSINLNSGTYLVVMKSTEGIKTRKLIYTK